MARIRHGETGTETEVTNEVAERMLATGRYELADGETIDVVHQGTGARTSVEGDTFASDRALRPTTAQERVEDLRADRHRREYGEGLANQFQAAVGGLIKGVSLGIVNPYEEEQNYFRTTATVGELAGIVGPGLLTGGGSLAARAGGGAVRRAIARTPAGIVSGIGERVGARVLAPGVKLAEQSAARRVGSLGVSAAVEGGLASGVSEVSRQVHEDGDLDLEAAASKALTGGLVGGGLGVGLGALGTAGQGIVGKMRGGSGASRRAVEAASRVDVPRNLDEIVPATRSRTSDMPGDALSAVERKGARDWQGEAVAIENDIKRMRSVARRAEQDFDSWSSRLDDPEAANIKLYEDTLDDALDSLAALKDRSTPRAGLDSFVDNMRKVQALADELDVAGHGARVPKMFRADEFAARVEHAMGRGIDDPAARFARELDDGQLEDMAALWLIRDPSRRGTDLAKFRGSRGLESGFLDRVPYVGKIVQAVKDPRSVAMGAATAIGTGHGIGALGSAVGTVAAAAPVAGAALVGSRLLRNPTVGGVALGGAAHVLSSTPLFVGDTPQAARTTDSRRALRDFATRLRDVDRGRVGASAASFDYRGGEGTGALAAMMSRRLDRLTALVDRVVPVPSATDRILGGGPLPSASAARTIADHVAVATSPEAALRMLAEGRLTPELLETLEAVFPRSAATLRMMAASMLADRGGADGLPPRSRKSLETILGAESRRHAYASAMQASAGRAMQAKAPQAPSSTVKVDDLYTDRTSRAAGR